ncbi:MAG: HPF/RaiA family ribosome-associated protein [Candidatus Eremiobacteraeota bacterium]|nr:HPF/RaiA family ribosome-associated protein [Candidatus Eremiobacteraeota bacterium]
MAVQPQIAYRDVEPSPALDHLIQAEAAKLERFFHGIISCRVLVEHSNRRHKHGSPFNVRIELSLPGTELIVNHGDDVRPVPPASDDEPERVHKSAEHEGHKDPQLATRDAFKTMTRRLQEYVKHLRR